MRTFTIVLVVSAVFASTAAVSVKQQRRWTEKLDATLAHTVEQGSPDPVKALVRVRPGASDRIMSHLAKHGLNPARVASPDLIAVQVPVSMVRTIASDPDVVRVSLDAIVVGLQSNLEQN